ncbi:MAG: antibiotic biosynthesis monooxygenase [Chloroflexi bacterium]|nr:antibiotic biosynthesis monooxygenase [Chloroflexota bacterium]
MPVTVTLGLQVKLDKLDEFKQAIKAAIPDTRAFSGCISIRVLEDQDKPGAITLLEVWDTKEDQTKYIAWRTETGFMEALAGMLESEPVIIYHDDLNL